MFIGHFAIGLSAKTIDHRPSLGTYFLAAQFVDLLWPVLLLLNLEEVAVKPGNTEMTPLNFLHYPISHSLIMAVVWALAGFAVYYLVRKNVSAGLVIAACVASHWLLDFFTHRPDLPLTFSETTKVGLGLWNYKWATLAIEATLFALGVVLYVKATKSIDKIGKFGFAGLIGFLLLIHIGNIFGPPPPSVHAIAWAGNLQWLFVVWAYWVDAHRQARPAGA